MIQKMFSVRDSKAQAFLQPFFSSANGSALRAMADAVADHSTSFSKHPEDYILYEVGAFDDQTGELVAVTPIRMLACASDFVSVTPVTQKPLDDRLEVLNGKK